MTQRSLAISLALIALGASVASADPLPGSLHESTSALKVPAGIRAVVVDVDAGDVTLRAGAPQGSAHERWNLQQPRVTVTTKNHTLRITTRCDGDGVSGPGVYVGTLGFCRVDLTLSVPAGVTVDLTGDAVSVTGTHGAVKVRASSPVVLSHVGPGPVDASSAAGSLRMTASKPASTLLRSSGAAAVSGVRTRSMNVTSDAGSISLSDVRATQLLASASSSASLTRVRASRVSVDSNASGATLNDVATTGAVAVRASSSVRLARVTAAAIDATSNASSVSVEDSSASGALLVRASSSASMVHVAAASATLTSDASSVSVQTTRLAGRLLAEASGSVAVDGLEAAGADLRSSSSSLDVVHSPLLDLVGTASGRIAVDLPVVPHSVRLVSDSSSLQLGVPRSSYAVTATSDAGQVSVHDIVIDDRAPRTLDLRASGDVTVN